MTSPAISLRPLQFINPYARQKGGKFGFKSGGDPWNWQEFVSAQERAEIVGWDRADKSGPIWKSREAMNSMFNDGYTQGDGTDGGLKNLVVGTLTQRLKDDPDMLRYVRGEVYRRRDAGMSDVMDMAWSGFEAKNKAVDFEKFANDYLDRDERKARKQAAEFGISDEKFNASPRLEWNRNERAKLAKLGPEAYYNETYGGEMYGEYRKVLNRKYPLDRLEISNSTYQIVNDYVHSWASSASDSSLKSLQMQQAARDLFGSGGKSWDGFVRGEAPGGVWSNRTQERMVKALVRETYKNTQEKLAKAGITEVYLSRGMSVRTVAQAMRDSGDLNMSEWKERPNGTRPYRWTSEIEVDANPLSSYSWMTSTASSFGGSAEAVLAMKVPAKNIFSTAISGPGCYHEQEVIVLNRGGQKAEAGMNSFIGMTFDGKGGNPSDFLDKLNAIANGEEFTP
jgi:hypothetical protein